MKLINKMMLAVGGISLASGSAMAATTGSEFTPLAAKLQGWAEGGLGLALAMIALLLGIGFSVAKQTALPFVFAIFVALAATIGPGVITGLFTAVI